ncbi:Programmed cell death protein 2 [Eumeta japonica]|uniref:Programmed cell death protein 2 n=1 Tax=Eumeta variegata TaxID=151549 RepID=A0A4C1WVB5_EUMVA|nr:Programmed cell death protein 2 [Eumeta japonica]
MQRSYLVKFYSVCLLFWEIGSATSFDMNNFVVTEAGKSILFNEWELVIDSEEKEESPDIDVNKEMEKMMKLLQEKKVGSLNNVNEQEIEQYARKLPEDKVFNKFNKRIARHPDQVLRYDRGGIPLWITCNSSESNNIINIPRCQYCSGERQFEFQFHSQYSNPCLALNFQLIPALYSVLIPNLIIHLTICPFVHAPIQPSIYPSAHSLTWLRAGGHRRLWTLITPDETRLHFQPFVEVSDGGGCRMVGRGVWC